jgi:RecB family exonuclease
LERDELLNGFAEAMCSMHVPREYYDSIDRRGREALAGYWDRYHPDFSLDVELEKKIRGIPFLLESGEEILLTGAIDKLVRCDDGTYAVVDYKTGKPWSRNIKEKKAALKRQIAFYKLLLDSYDDHRYNMGYGELDFIEPHPVTHEYEKEIIRVDARDVATIKKEINAFAQDILTGAFLDHPHTTQQGNMQLDEYIRFLNVLKR